MPVPKPQPGEEKDDFVGRCISAMKKTDPERPDKQIQAICFDAWRDTEAAGVVSPPAPNKTTAPKPDRCYCRGCGYVLENPSGHCADLTCPECGGQLYRRGSPTEGLNVNTHADFFKILNDFISIFGEAAGRQKYDEMINAYNIDVTKAYRDQAQMKECWGGICESYNWAKPLIQYLKEDEEAKYYKVRALTATVSMNRNDYTDITELERSARTIGYRPLNLNHDPLKQLPFPNSRVVSGDFEDKSVECIIRVANEGHVPNTNYSLKDVQRMLDDGDIVNPSIEAEPEGGRMTTDGRKIPEWWNYTALALLEKGVTLPGVPTTFGFEPLFFNESLGRSLVESLSVETHEREEKNMSKPEHLPDIEEPKTELVEGQGIQNIDVCGQCKFFSDLVNTTETAPAVTGAFPTSAEVTISSGAVGPGVGLCSVDGEYKQKQDPACTDGRPREQATNLDRVGGVESMNELIMETQINDLKTELLLSKQAETREIAGHVETQKEVTALQDRLARKEKELTVVTLTKQRLSAEVPILQEKNGRLKDDNTRKDVHIKGLEADVALYKSEASRFEEQLDMVKRTLAELKEEILKIRGTLNEEVAKRATATARALSAEEDNARTMKENVDLNERLVKTHQELTDSLRTRSDGAMMSNKLQRENADLREEDKKKTESLRDLKKLIERLKKKDFDIEISL